MKMGQKALEDAPEFLERSSNIVGGLARTAEESQPVLQKVAERIFNASED